VQKCQKKNKGISSLLTPFSLNNQSLAHTRASNISPVNELLDSPRILPPRLKADLEGTASIEYYECFSASIQNFRLENC
jgi:hypothetical protein